MFFAIRVAGASAALTCVAALAANIEFGSQRLSNFTLGLAYLSSWPSLLMGTQPELLFLHLVPTLFLNAVVWGGIAWVSQIVWTRTRDAK